MNAEVERLFLAVSELPKEQRGEYLDAHCTDAGARAEVESLLAYATSAEGYFTAAVGSFAASLEASAELAPGEQFGSYSVMSFLGRGGMGSVYLGRRADGAFDQQVAIKIAQSVCGEFLTDRFQQERHILALLDSPNIARILDGGQTSGGVPYLVMEYVDGEPIDAFCRNRNLSLLERLELFLVVCGAVRHAHGHLIVHRDLKPGNILVMRDGQPKLLDFGIAKILDPAHLQTGSTRLLTPEYASPEQVRGDPVTPAADIYSLGAVLHTLLTGQPPHSVEEMAPLDAARTIAEKEIDPAPLRALPTDLAAVLAKALRNDIAQRYRSVEEFSADLRRYLDGHPVLAKPAGAAYRFRRFAARNKWPVSIAALVAVLLIASTAVSIAQARRAERRFRQVRELANVFLFDFERSIADVPGTLEARRMVTATAKRYLAQLSAEAAGDKELQREIADAYERLGDVLDKLRAEGGTEASIESFRRAYDIRHMLGDESSPDAARRGKVIRLASTIAMHYQMHKSAAEATAWGEQAAHIAEVWASAEPAKLEALDAAHSAFRSQGGRLETAGQYARSTEAFEKSIRYGEMAHLIGSSDHHTDFNLANTEYVYSNMLLNMRHAPEALAHAQRAIAVAEKLHAIDPANSRWIRVYQMSLSSAGIAHRALANSDPAALPHAVSFLTRSRGLAADAMLSEPKDARAKDDFIAQSHRLARSLIQSDKAEEAAALFDQAGEAARELVSLDPRSRRFWYLLAKNQTDYGAMRLDQHRHSSALQLLSSADSAFDRALALDPQDAVLLETRASQLEKLAEAAERTGNLSRARIEIRHCLDILEGMIQRDSTARTYIGDFEQKLVLARRLGVSTRGLAP